MVTYKRLQFTCLEHHCSLDSLRSSSSCIMSNKSTVLFQSTQAKIFSAPKANNAFYPTVSNPSQFIRNARSAQWNAEFLLSFVCVVILARRAHFVPFQRNERIALERSFP